MAKKNDGVIPWVIGGLVLLFGLGAKGSGGTNPGGGGGGGGGGGDDPGPGGDYDDDDDDKPNASVVIGNLGGFDPPPGEPPRPVEDPFFPVDVPVKPGEPTGPTPQQIDDLIRSYPTPGSFYQVKTGDNFTGQLGVATRMARTALFLAAKEHGGLGDAEANAWAGARDDYQGARLPLTKLIACTPWNDALYGTYAYGAGSVAGLQGRAIRMLNTSAPNVARIRGGEPPIRNVRICAPGDPASCSAYGVNSSYRGFELLWLTGIDLAALWSSGGKDWRPGGAWEDGSSQMQPPPLIWGLGYSDLTNAGISNWGCAPYQKAVP